MTDLGGDQQGKEDDVVTSRADPTRWNSHC